MTYRKGSILYSVMVIVLCSTISVRNYRLLKSHIYIEEGIYSFDVRVNQFLLELKEVEDHLNVGYESAALLTDFLKTGRKIRYKDFRLAYDSSYNGEGIHMLSVLDHRFNYYRKVLVIEEEELIKLINKGV